MSLHSKRKGKSSVIVRQKKKTIKENAADSEDQNLICFRMELEIEERKKLVENIESKVVEKWRFFQRNNSQENLKDFVLYKSQRMDEVVHLKDQFIMHKVRLIEELDSLNSKVFVDHANIVGVLSEILLGRQKGLESIFQAELTSLIGENVQLFQSSMLKFWNGSARQNSFLDVLSERIFRKINIDDRMFYGTFERVVLQRYFEAFSQLQTQAEIDTETRIEDSKRNHNLYSVEIARWRGKYNLRREEESLLSAEVLNQLIRIRKHCRCLLTWKMKWINNLKNYVDRNQKIYDERTSLFKSLLKLKSLFQAKKKRSAEKLKELVFVTRKLRNKYVARLQIASRCLEWENYCRKLEKIDIGGIRTNWIGGGEGSIMKKLQISKKLKYRTPRRRIFTPNLRLNYRRSSSSAMKKRKVVSGLRRYSTSYLTEIKKKDDENHRPAYNNERIVAGSKILEKIKTFQKRMNQAVIESFTLEDIKMRMIRKNILLKEKLRVYLKRINLAEEKDDFSATLVNRKKSLVKRTTQVRRRYSNAIILLSRNKRPHTTSMLVASRGSIGRNRKFLY